MSYNTKYKLTLQTGYEFKWKPRNFMNIIADLRRNNKDAEYALDFLGNTYESCSWYESDSELTEFSKKYPDVLFTLDMFGEESGDIRRYYFHNGTQQEAEVSIIYSEFKENK